MQPATHPTRIQSTWTIRDLLLVTTIAAIAMAVNAFGSENGIGVTSQQGKFPELLTMSRIGQMVSAIFIAAWVFLALSICKRLKRDRGLSVQPGHFLALVVAASGIAGVLASLAYATGHHFFSHPAILSNGETAVIDPNWLGLINMNLSIALSLAVSSAWLFIILRFKLEAMWRMAFSCFLLIAVLQIVLTSFMYAHMSGNALGGTGLSSATLGYVTMGLAALKVVLSWF